MILIPILAVISRAVALSAESTAAVLSPYSVKEDVHVSKDWIKHSNAPKGHIINLTIFLTQPNFHLLENALYQVSDPEHMRYGEHLSKEDVDIMVAPHPETVSLVDAWLISHGLNLSSVTRADGGDWLSMKVTVEEAEVLLQTKYYVWEHRKNGARLVRTTRYSLPETLHEHIDVIQPTTSFSLLKAQSVESHISYSQPISLASLDGAGPKIKANGQDVDASCNQTMTISCVRQLYNAVGVHASGISGSEIGVTGYLEQYPSRSDYQIFRSNQTGIGAAKEFEIVLVNGGLNNQSDPAEESNFDTQYAFGLTEPMPGTFWSTGGRPPFKPDDLTPIDRNEPYVDWLNFILAQKTIPQVISTSYGDTEQSVPPSYAQRVCRGFAQLGARGTSVIFGSGDGGVGDRNPDPATQACIANDGTNRTRFLPIFPASCPYVTAVSATVLVPEVAASFSGGGFSNIFGRPSYQQKAVPSYLETLPNGTYAGLFNPNGRGIPDVAVQGVDYLFFFNGTAGLFTGTSASAPTFAGLIALINDRRLLRKQKPLGFLNPAIYKLPSMFNDITKGRNPGCGTPGFSSVEGWDPGTGLGTPDIGKLLGSLV